MESLDMTKANIDMIAELFPQVVTEVAEPNGAKDAEGKPILRKAIDFEKLKLVLSAGTGEYVVADDERERYEFTWVGKRQAMIDAATPIRKTLRPCPEESKDWETTENLYIEGDNLEVLKLLQESYLGKVKMIYIDPPYNTGKDFIYKDNFTQSREEYEGELDMFDEDGNRLFQNTETNGRFHSDWCSMIYPRLQLARNLLTDDGVIFISIDDNEVRNLKNICDEVFGESNYITTFAVQNNPRGRQSDTFVATVHESLICYSKVNQLCKLNGMPLTDSQKKDYCFADEKGAYRLLGLRQRGSASLREDRPDMFFPIYVDTLTENISLTEVASYEKVLPKKSDGREGRWMWGIEKCTNDFDRLVAKRIDRRNQYDIFVKDYLIRNNEERTRKYKTIWDDKSINNQFGTQEVKALLNGDFMSFPKSSFYIKMIVQLGANLNDIILDFFSGSATTAHAVMQLNAEDDGNRKFIMVQLPEKCDAKSDTAKAGYKNICEIGKERIRRAGTKIAAEQEAKNDDLFTEDTNNLDTGFRVFKLDSTNMKDVYYAAGELKQSDLWDTVSNIKDDRTDIDLLYGCLLDWGVPLSMPHTTEKIDGSTVHTVDSPQTDEVDLIACFDQEVTESTVRAIAARKPMRAVFRDWSFRDSADKINVTEIFKALSPDTTVKVI